ncbi:hypothetical protein HBI06_255290 [Parastagonospora nodorum]|nr:hypothetical protein HBI06_255290 [Parastagonospora nodorum]KAH5096406.1 hypothetical protein HBH71_253670 [Parastagonospora nodorum]
MFAVLFELVVRGFHVTRDWRIAPEVIGSMCCPASASLRADARYVAFGGKEVLMGAKIGIKTCGYTGDGFRNHMLD